MPTSTAPTRTPDTDEIVVALLTARKGEWESIAERSGVSYSWISKFMNQKIPNPGSATLKKLRLWLEANPSPAPHHVHAPAAADAGGPPSLGASSEPPA